MERLLNRRTLLGATAAVSAVGLAGCRTKADSDQNRKVAEQNAQALLPTYRPVELAEPDLPGVDLLPPGYFTYPRNTEPAITDKPGAGLDGISIMYQTFQLIPKGPDTNSFWRLVQDGVGTDLNLQPISAADYATKFQTMAAGGDMPDIVNLPPNVAERPKLLEQMFADLGPLLSGDAVEQFPFLANIPTFNWSSTVSNGTIYAVPQRRSIGGNGIFYRGDVFEKLGLSPDVQNGEELVELMKALSNERERRWAFSNPGDILMFLVAMMGGPNEWAEQDGVFTSAYDHPAYREALLQTAELVKIGCAHPESVATPYEQHREYFYSGTTGLLSDGPAGWDLYVRSLPEDARLGTLAPPKWEGGGDAPSFQGVTLGMSVINKNLTGDRLVSALKVLNYLAAPIGSSEHLARKYGEEGADFTWVDDRPELTDQGKHDQLDLQYIVDAPIILGPGNRTTIEDQHAWYERASQNLIYNPTAGLYSETQTRKGAALGRALNDVIGGVIFGRNTPDEFDAALKKWHTDGGDAIAEELAESKAASSPS